MTARDLGRGRLAPPSMLLAAAVGLLAAGCGPTTVPTARFYALRGPRVVLPPPPAGARLEVAEFAAAPGYGDPRLAYRTSRVEVRYDPYRRWVAEPGRMMAHAVATHLRASGAFAAVELHGQTTSADAALVGVVEALEEQTDSEGISAHLALTFHLRRGDTVTRIYAFDRVRPCKRKSAEAVAEALSDLLAAEMPTVARIVAESMRR